MMNYCVSLEIAKELKKNGFPQKTFWMYNKEILTSLAFLDSNLEDLISAPISDELLEQLPNNIYINKEFDEYQTEFIDEDGNSVYVVDDKFLSNALAYLWIQLKKQGYIK